MNGRIRGGGLLRGPGAGNADGVKAAIIAAFSYFIVPTDLIPDVIIGLGYTDDITVSWAAWRVVSRYITDAHRARAAKLLDRPPRDEDNPGVPSIRRPEEPRVGKACRSRCSPHP